MATLAVRVVVIGFDDRSAEFLADRLLSSGYRQVQLGSWLRLATRVGSKAVGRRFVVLPTDELWADAAILLHKHLGAQLVIAGSHEVAVHGMSVAQRWRATEAVSLMQARFFGCDDEAAAELVAALEDGSLLRPSFAVSVFGSVPWPTPGWVPAVGCHEGIWVPPWSSLAKHA